MKLIMCTCLLAIGLVTPVSSQELRNTLHSTSYGVHVAYAGETVTFTCMTIGSNTIAWSSDEYIGSDGNRLEFIPVDMEGATQRVGQTVATLVNISSVEGVVILVSQLQISVQSTYQISSITCHSLGNDAVNTISFLTADNTSVTCDKPAACPGETVTCTCRTGHSNTIAWSSDEFIGQGGVRLEWASDDPLQTRRNVTNSSTFAVLTGSSDLNGVVVLTSFLSFAASRNSDNIFICENVDLQSSYPIIVPMSRNCEADSTTTSAVTNDLNTTEVDTVTLTDGSRSTGNCEADSTTTSTVTNDLNTTEVDTVTLTDGSRCTGTFIGIIYVLGSSNIIILLGSAAVIVLMLVCGRKKSRLCTDVTAAGKDIELHVTNIY